MKVERYARGALYSDTARQDHVGEDASPQWSLFDTTEEAIRRDWATIRPQVVAGTTRVLRDDSPVPIEELDAHFGRVDALTPVAAPFLNSMGPAGEEPAPELVSNVQSPFSPENWKSPLRLSKDDRSSTSEEEFKKAWEKPLRKSKKP